MISIFSSLIILFFFCLFSYNFERVMTRGLYLYNFWYQALKIYILDTFILPNFTNINRWYKINEFIHQSVLFQGWKSDIFWQSFLIWWYRKFKYWNIVQYCLLLLFSVKIIGIWGLFQLLVTSFIKRNKIEFDLIWFS